MKEEIEAIIENNKVLALNATATLITHKSMLIFLFNWLTDLFKKFRYFEDENQSNKLIKPVGNISNDFQISFQYGVLCSGIKFG